MATKDTKLNIIVDAQDRTKGTFRSLENNLDRSNSSIGSVVGIAAKAAAGLYALKTAFDAVSSFVGVGLGIAADLETAEVGLQTLLGSADAAAETVARLKIEAARTPFELPGLTQATQLLTSVTKDGNKSIDILLNVGEALAAMGKGQAELDRIVVNMQQIAATGKAATIDIKQFAFAGIPIYEMLAETTGKTGDELAAFIEEGGVTFDILTTMFDQANDSGGRFFNAFVNQSGTFNQTLANLKDSFGLFTADIVQNSGIFDGIIAGMQELSWLFANYQQVAGEAYTRTVDFIAQFDAATGIVTQLREAFSSIVQKFRDEMMPALAELIEALKPMKPLFDGLVTVVGVLLVGAIRAAILFTSQMIESFMGVVTTVAKISTAFYSVVGPAFEWFLEKIEPVIEAVEKLVNLLKKASILAEGFSGKGIGSAVRNLIGGDSESVDDAVISPAGKIISTHPDDYIIATKNPASLAGGANIYITGNTLLDQDAAEKMGDLLMRRLQLSRAM